MLIFMVAQFGAGSMKGLQLHILLCYVFLHSAMSCNDKGLMAG